MKAASLHTESLDCRQRDGAANLLSASGEYVKRTTQTVVIEKHGRNLEELLHRG